MISTLETKHTECIYHIIFTGQKQKGQKSTNINGKKRIDGKSKALKMRAMFEYFITQQKAKMRSSKATRFISSKHRSSHKCLLPEDGKQMRN